jgi:hypothetical protein
MPKLFFSVIFSFSISYCLSQPTTDIKDSIIRYITEIKKATTAHSGLWKKNIYGALLFVNPTTRQVYSNYQDSAGVLRLSGQLFEGVLPTEINIANTSLHWSGRNWAMVMLQLPTNKQNRINFIAHELFHRVQKELGFSAFNPDNNHLDTKEGRIYLRLELEALQKSLLAINKVEMKKHLVNAFVFRKQRHSLFASADSTENLLELNEGITEYSGMIMADRNKQETVKHFIAEMNLFLQNQTFVRSFAYQTTPVYGYLLSLSDKNWNKKINVSTNLTYFFIKAFNLTTHLEIKSQINTLSAKYNGKKIREDEKIREDKMLQIIADYKNKFITLPHFDIYFEQMNISFNPGNITPLEGSGTVYPNVRVTDNWGILTVENGALIGSNWDKVTVTAPDTINSTGGLITGNGWRLELKKGYELVKDKESRNFKLRRKND